MTTIKMYKIQEVAEILAVHKATVRALLKRGKLEGMKLGSHWRISEDEVRNFLGLQGNEQRRTGEGPQKD